MTTFEFPQFPCSHLNSCDCIKPECRLNLKEFERLVVYEEDEVGQVSVVPITSYRISGNNTLLDPFNPFCGECYFENVNLMLSLGYSETYSNKNLRGIKDHVCNEIINSKEFDYDGDCWYEWDISTYTDRICEDDEMLTAWVELESFEDDEVKPTPASKVSIEALARSIIKKYECANCVICLEELYDNKKEGTLRVTMPCKHEFHEGCIVEWLHTSNFCPLCRFELPTSVADN